MKINARKCFVERKCIQGSRDSKVICVWRIRGYYWEGRTIEEDKGLWGNKQPNQTKTTKQKLYTGQGAISDIRIPVIFCLAVCTGNLKVPHTRFSWENIEGN